VDAIPVNALQREFEFSDQDFERLRQLVHAQLGIALSANKRALVYGRLTRRLRALRLTDFDSYIKRLEQGDAGELQHFHNAITTNLTAFFREAHHFEYLATQLLPALARENAATRRIRIWSAGCSSGEEPYSIAIVIREQFAQWRDWDIRILATDVDTNMLERARLGRYEPDRVEKLPAASLQRWFVFDPAAGCYLIRDEIRKLVSFKGLNLVQDWPMQGAFDAIFCRNVVIYFDRATQRDIFARMQALQRVGDHLILGHAESLLCVSSDYRLVGQTVYRKGGA
jgi:chemotaxis protein methyltransferase CheR